MANEKIPSNYEKLILEYPLSSTSVPMIWDAISTGPGLAAWFADDVKVTGKLYTFMWGKHESRVAELTNCRQSTYVRFHWQDEAPGTFCELRILKNDLTGNYTLEVTECVQESEIGDQRSLWDSAVEALRRCGL